MYIVVDAEFFLPFSGAFATEAEAEAKLDRVNAWAREQQWEHEFIVTHADVAEEWDE